MPTYAFNLNGNPVSVTAPADMPLLWVLRDQLGITGPKYGCGVGVCRACTSHINGQAAQICTVTIFRRGRQKRRHHRRARQKRSATPSTTGLARRRRRPMRILPTRPDHAGRRHAQNQQDTDRCRHRRNHERMPLRHLLPHPHRHQTRRRRHVIEHASAASEPARQRDQGKRGHAPPGLHSRPACVTRSTMPSTAWPESKPVAYISKADAPGELRTEPVCHSRSITSR